MFTSFTHRDTGLDVAFESADVKLVAKTIYAVTPTTDARYGTDVTLRDGTVVPLSTNFDTVVAALRLGATAVIPFDTSDQS